MRTELAAARRPRILVTRAAGQASALAEELQRLGADPVILPVIEIVPPDSYAGVDYALHSSDEFDWVVFTSANAVTAMAERAKLLRVVTPFQRLKIAAIGAATARSLRAVNLQADVVPATAVAESLTQALLPFARKPNGDSTRFLLIRAQEGRELIHDALREAGAEVTVAPAYKTEISEHGTEALRMYLSESYGRLDGLTLASSSAARNFFAMLAAADLKLDSETVIASIGPITSETLRELGYSPHVEAREATVSSLAEEIVSYLRAESF